MNIEYTKLAMWWHQPSFVKAIISAILIFFGLIFWIEHIRPPEGHIFERLPSVSGSFNCCNGDGRYGKSFIGQTQIICGPITYFPIGRPGNDCSAFSKLNNEEISAVRARIPSIFSDHYVIISIHHKANKIHHLDDQQISELWITGSRSSAWSISVIVFLLIYFLLNGLRK